MKVYATRIENISEWELNCATEKITKERRDKINKFINKKDKIRSLIAEILLRTILVEELGLNNINFAIRKNKYGKPYLEEGGEVNFNISHSGDLVVCAVDNKPIGIDIEQILEIDYQSIVESFFSKSDVEFILSAGNENKLERFYEIWTLKESYIKAKGMGLSIPLKSFGFKFQDNSIRLINDEDKYNFKQFNMFEGYKMSVCSLSKEITNKIIEVNQNILIHKYYKLCERYSEVR